MASVLSVAKVDCLPAGKALAVSMGSKRIALFNIDGRFYAIDDECTHAGGSLAEGTLNGNIVTCPWHGATFDVTNGAVLSDPAYENVGHYQVRVEGDDIKVEIP